MLVLVLFSSLKLLRCCGKAEVLDESARRRRASVGRRILIKRFRDAEGYNIPEFQSPSSPPTRGKPLHGPLPLKLLLLALRSKTWRLAVPVEQLLRVADSSSRLSTLKLEIIIIIIIMRFRFDVRHSRGVCTSRDLFLNTCLCRMA